MLQQLVANFSRCVAGYGQYGFTPLLSPELCSYGGRFFGRAFDPSAIVADSCLMGLGELRHDLPVDMARTSRRPSFMASADYGHLYNHDVARSIAGTWRGGCRIGWRGNSPRLAVLFDR